MTLPHVGDLVFSRGFSSIFRIIRTASEKTRAASVAEGQGAGSRVLALRALAEWHRS